MIIQTIVTLKPAAEVIDVLAKCNVFLGREKTSTKSFFNFALELIQTHVVYSVLETIGLSEYIVEYVPGMFPVCAISVISLNQHNGFRYFTNLIRRTESK
jgi:hypothetical protein